MVLRLPDSWSNWNLEMLIFEVRSTRRKTSRSNKGENQQKTQPTHGVEPWPNWWEASALTTAPPLLSKEQEEFTNHYRWIASIWRDWTKYQTPVYHVVQQLN